MDEASGKMSGHASGCSHWALGSQLAPPRHADGMPDVVTLPQIVLATNIAETAVTIDDIVCVINSGRMKEKGYDPYMVRLPCIYFAHWLVSLACHPSRPKSTIMSQKHCLSVDHQEAASSLILRCQKVSQAKAWPNLHPMHALLDPHK